MVVRFLMGESHHLVSVFSDHVVMVLGEYERSGEEKERDTLHVWNRRRQKNTLAVSCEMSIWFFTLQPRNQTVSAEYKDCRKSPTGGRGVSFPESSPCGAVHARLSGFRLGRDRDSGPDGWPEHHRLQRPRRRLYPINRNPAVHGFSADGDNPLNFVSQPRGSLQSA